MPVTEAYFSACDIAGGTALPTTWTDISFDTQKYVNSVVFSHTPGSANITANVTANYEIQADVTINQTAGSTRSLGEIRLVKNGAPISGTKGQIYSRNAAQGGGSATVRIVESITAGDIIKVQGIKVSGGNLLTYPEGCRVLLKKINV